jgi:elongation factor P
MSTTSEIKNGLCIKYNNDIYKIIEFLHVKPGKGPAFVRTKLKSLTNGKVVDNTFSAGHKIDKVRVETNKYQYLYNDSSNYHFMNTDDYNQISIQEKFLDYPQLMKEGEIVTVITNSETGIPLSVEMPPNVILEVVSTEPGVKGTTATNATKPATLEAGAIVNVPLFINEGDKIKVDTVGPIFTGVAVRLSEDGEILVKGENLMFPLWPLNYSNNPTLNSRL